MNKLRTFYSVRSLAKCGLLTGFLVIFCLGHSLFAQTCDTTFLKRIGNTSASERAFKILPTPSGNLLIGGSKQNTSLLMMVTPNGSIVWERSFDFGTGDDFIFDMMLDSEGKLTLIGRDALNPATYTFAMRYDYQTQAIIWTKKLSGVGNPKFEGLLELPNGNFMVYGTIQPSGGAGQDNLVLELNKNTGSMTWLKSYNNGNTDIFADAILKNGVCYTANNQRYGAIDKIRAAVSKLDTSGNQIWTKSYIKDQASSARMYGVSIKAVNDTLVVFGQGNLTGSEINYTFQLFTTDLDGNIIWAKNYQVNGGSGHFAGTVIPVPDGFILQGYYTRNSKTEIIIFKVNKQGVVQWAKAIGSSGNENCLSITYHNNHLYFAGYSDELDTNNDILLGKMSLYGEIFGAGCSHIENVTILANNLPSPYSGSSPMNPIAASYVLDNISITPVAVASFNEDLPGCGCEAVGVCNNLLVNSGFENGLAGWSVTGNVTTTTDAKNGTNAAMICGTTDGSVSQIYPAIEGEIFSASLWAKTISPPSNAFAQLRFLNAGFTPITQGSDKQFFLSTAYEHYNLNAVAPPGTAYVHFLVYKQGSQCTTFDDMEICKQSTTQGIPDLNISNISLPTINANTVQAGSHLPINFTLSNLGTSNAPSGFDVKIYVSSTPTLTPNSVLLTSLSQQSMTSGASLNLSSSPVLSSSLTPGNYYLVVVADQANTVAESNENNNQASSQAFTVYGSCALVANVSTATCHDNGTPNLVTDDYFSFTVSAINTLQSIGYYLLIAPSNQTLGISYGVGFNITNMPISGGNVSLKFTDSLNPSCTQTLTVAAPPACSVSLPDLVAANLTAPNTVNPGQTYPFSFSVTNSSSANITGQSLNHSLYLSTDNQFDNTDLLVGGSSFSDSFAPNALNNYGPLNFTVPAVQAGNYYLILFIDKNQAIAESNEANNKIYIPITIQAPPSSGDIDLSLTITSPTTAPIYTSYPTAITITNSGSIPATGVKVVCQKPNGVVYTGGNEFTASQGTFGPLTNQEWNVGTLAPGTSATLTVNYFLLQNTLPVVYAQVTAANEPDADSTPNNGTPPTPNEDDEASSAGAPPPPPPAQPDLTLSNLTAPTSISAGLGNFTFTLKNIGTAAAQGNYQIGSFLSTDNVLSADDYAFATIAEQNTAVGSYSRTGSFDLPNGFAFGNYYLIVKVDVGSAIAEGNENNNTVSRPITVTGMVCTGDMILESQAEVDAFSGCNIIDGDLIIRSPNGNTGASSDINDLSPLASISSINGNLLIENNDLLTDLQGLNQVVHLGSLVITHCENLDNLQALSGITGALENFVSWDNLSLSNINALSGISTINQTFSIIRNASLTNLNGLSNIGSVGGSFEINENTALVDIQALSGLSEIGKDFLIANNNMLTSLNGLENLTSVGLGFVLAANEELSDASALSNLTNIGGNFYVALNQKLADCCVFNHLLTSNAITGTITINDNAGNCNSLISIIDNCTPQGVDLELAMTATNPSPSIYTSFPVKLTITNASGQAATGVEVAFPRLSGVVYEGGNEFTVSKGAFNAFGNERWYLGDLAAGESATITVSYFLLTSNALQPYAQVFACNEPDSDSSPNNGISPIPNEDDEATVGINSFAGNNGSTSLRLSDNRQRLNFDRIYPNPVQYMVTVDLYSQHDQSATMEFYNQQGQLVQSMEVQLEKGQNLFEVMVSDWKSGAYNIIAKGEKMGLPAYGRFLKVWEE